MKKLILSAATLICFTATFAQTRSGTITYKETLKLDLNLEGDMAQFAELIPKETNFNKVLYFTPEVSVYEADKKATEKVNTDNSIKMMITSSMPQEKTYRDLKTNATVTQREFMSRKFLVTATAEKQPWKMTGKQKKILNLPCQQAIMVKDSQEVEAWFTPAIPVATGPGDFAGLPGLVLEVSIGKMYHIEASSLQPGAVDKKLLSKPTEGKKMTGKQYEDMMREKTKEMQEQFGGMRNGNISIRVQQH